MPKPDPESPLREQINSFTAQLRGAPLQELFNYLHGIYFVVKNRQGVVMMANKTAIRLCGFEHELDMLGKTDFDIFPREKAEGYVKGDAKVFKTGQPLIEQVELAPDPNNSINWLVSTKIPLHSESGEVIGLACIARDMSGAFEKLRPYIEMNTVLEYILEHYKEPIQNEDLARLAGLSTSQFERRFRETFHTSPGQHIMQVRLREACKQLVSSNDTITSIALELGFYDHSHFSRCFKKSMGMSPGEYREHQ